MPFWAWLGFTLLIAYNSFLLYRAWKHHCFKYGPIVYPRKDTPGYFWFFVLLTGACEVFLVAFYGLVVVSSIWGPVIHQ